MIIELDNNSEIPIYSQLVMQIKLGILNGKLRPGDSLPSVRSLASDIGINLHTVNKSYKELVSEGLVTQLKKGYEIAQPQISPDYLETFRGQIEAVLIDAKVFGIDLEKILAELNQKLEGDGGHD